MTLRRLDGEWSSDRLSDVAIYDGEGRVETDGPPATLVVEPAEASTYRGQLTTAEGPEPVELELAPDWLSATLRLNDRPPYRLERRSFVSYDVPVPTPWPTLVALLAAFDDLAIHARLAVSHAGHEAVVHPYRWLGDRLLFLEIPRLGGGGGYRDAPGKRLPSLHVQERDWLDGAKIALGLTDHLHCNLDELDGRAVIESYDRAAAEALLRRSEVATALLGLLDTKAHRIRLRDVRPEDPAPQLEVTFEPPDADQLLPFTERGLLALATLAASLSG